MTPADRLWVPSRPVPEVGREDQERLDQREEHRNDHHDRNRLRELAGSSGHVEHRREGEAGRDDREGNRKQDLSGPVDRGLLRRLLELGPVAIDVLRNDDRVVDQDPEHENEAEARQEVQRHSDPG